LFYSSAHSTGAPEARDRQLLDRAVAQYIECPIGRSSMGSFVIFASPPRPLQGHACPTQHSTWKWICWQQKWTGRWTLV